MPTNKAENKTVEIKMDNIDIQTNIIIPGIEFKFLSTKQNEYGTSQLVQVLDEQQFQYIFKLAEEILNTCLEI